MCTLTFLPGLPAGGYLLATNRDESPRRGEALPPFVRALGERLVLAPRDRDAGGTWIGVDDRGVCLSILNGDRPHAVPAPPDARSRGLLVLELLDDPRPQAVRAALTGLERAGALRFKPFKLVVAAPGHRDDPGQVPDAAGPGTARLLCADWDGVALRFDERSGPQCIVSSSFEPEAVAAARGAAFEDLVARARRVPREATELATEQHAFHAGHAPDAPAGDAYSVCMHRPDARTVSATQIVVDDDEVLMQYQAGWPCEQGPVVLASLPRAG